jgi:Rrf2 family protein
MMVVFARHTNGDRTVVSLSEVASEANVSRRYLEQLVIGLKNAALIRGKSGKGGGYLLAKPADQIPLRQIIESAIGPINIVECVGHPEGCLKADFCECRVLYDLINKKITSVMDSLMLSDLADDKRLKTAVALLDSEPTTSGGSSCRQN